MNFCGRQKVVQRKMVLLFFPTVYEPTVLVDNRDSFENVSTKWMAEIHENCPGVKMVLTALKCDLRKDEEQNENPDAVTFDEGLAKAKEVGAVKYLECSAVQNRGIRETFYEAAKVALEVKPASSSSSHGCVIL
uniref:GTP-binding protein rho3 n=1 Tax=Talaromyces marneffei PM1 TaxID=1077442 RepID=A0A093XWC5_TALMA